MSSNNLGKKIFVLGFLLFVLIGIFIWQGNNLSQEYFNWLKTGILRTNPFKANINPEIELSKDSGLDLSNVNLKEIIANESKQEQEQEQEQKDEEVIEDEVAEDEEIIGIGGPIPSEELEQEIVAEDLMTLEEIQQEVNRIAQEVERINKEVQELIALSEQEIDE